MVRWIHITDLQLGRGKAEANDNDACARLLVERVARDSPDFVIDSGDLIHGGFRGQATGMIDEYWSDYHSAMSPLEGKCVVIPAPGNHDVTGDDQSMDRYCLETGRSGQPPYYAITIRDVHVVCLDVVASPHRGGFPKGSQQEEWLRQELSRPTQARCIVAVGHYPIFMSPEIYGTSDSSLCYDEFTGQEGVLLPILLGAGVDFYLCGHLHIYERTRRGRLTQVMAGADGIAYRDLMQYKPNRFCQAINEGQCFVRYTLTDTTVHGEAVSLEGEVVDAWTQKLNR